MNRKTLIRRAVSDFAANLRSIRLKKKIPQTVIAQRCDVPPSYICALESGRKSPQLSTVVRLAAALGVKPETLVAARKKSEIGS